MSQPREGESPDEPIPGSANPPMSQSRSAGILPAFFIGANKPFYLNPPVNGGMKSMKTLRIKTIRFTKFAWLYYHATWLYYYAMSNSSSPFTGRIQVYEPGT